MTLYGVADYPQAIWDLATGKTREELERLRVNLAVQRKQIESMTATVATMPDGPVKSAAWAVRVKAQQAWQPVVREFNDAAIAHNDASARLKAATAGLYDAGRVSTSLSGLGLAPLVIGAGVTIALVSILMSVATLIDSIKSRSTEVRGYMDQFAEIVKQGGGVIEKTGESISRVTWAILGLGAVFAAYKLYQEFRPEIRSAVQSAMKPKAAAGAAS